MKTRIKLLGVAIAAILLLVLSSVWVMFKQEAMAPPVRAKPPSAQAKPPLPAQPLAQIPGAQPLPQQPAARPPAPYAPIDRILNNMEFGNIAFNAPKSMNIHDTAVIQLMLGLSTPMDELKRMIKAEGDKEGAQLKIADRMEARLSGPNFSITAITPETQAVSRSEVTAWKWEVKPTNEGRQYLHLTLSALLSVDGTSTPRAIRTFDKLIVVEVSWDQRISSFFENNWQWLWATVLVPISGWLWAKRGRRRMR